MKKKTLISELVWHLKKASISSLEIQVQIDQGLLTDKNSKDRVVHYQEEQTRLKDKEAHTNHLEWEAATKADQD